MNETEKNPKTLKNLMYRGTLFTAAVAWLTPLAASAQGISGLISDAQGLINQLIPLAASLTLLAFFWGLAKYIFNAGSEEAQEQGKRIMVGGIVALFLIAAVGGIIDYLVTALGLEGGANISPPSIINLDSTEMMYNRGDGIG